jgi:hypothetical protein
MTNSQHHHRKPSSKQLRYLRSLAERCGESFTYPTSVAEASAEIKRLKGRRRTPRAERSREVAQVRQAMAERGGDGAAVCMATETVGYGSSAAWR